MRRQAEPGWEHWIPFKKMSQGSVIEELMASAAGTLGAK